MYVLPSAATNGTRTAWLLIVMPRSRSMSMRSRYCARIARPSTTPVCCSIRSASVDFPWSMCAMMQKLRRIDGSVAPGWGTVVAGCLGIVCPLFQPGWIWDATAAAGIVTSRAPRGSTGSHHLLHHHPPAEKTGQTRGEHQVADQAHPPERRGSRPQQGRALGTEDRRPPLPRG